MGKGAVRGASDGEKGLSEGLFVGKGAVRGSFRGKRGFQRVFSWEKGLEQAVRGRSEGFRTGNRQSEGREFTAQQVNRLCFGQGTGVFRGSFRGKRGFQRVFQRGKGAGAGSQRAVANGSVEKQG